MKKYKNIVLIIICCVSIICFCFSAYMIFSLDRSALSVGLAEYMNSKPFWVALFVAAFALFSIIFLLLSEIIGMKLKAFKKVIVAAGLFVISAIIILSIIFLYKNGKKCAEVQECYMETVGYVQENIDVYRKFFKYQISTADENSNYLTVERPGDIQQMRDVVFKPFSHAYVEIEIINFQEASMVCYNKTSDYEIYLYCFAHNTDIDRSKLPEQWDALKQVGEGTFLLLKSV